jgi:hypothetical protein
MPRTLPVRHLAGTFAVSLVLLLALLAAPVQTLAQTHTARRASCSTRAGAHAKSASGRASCLAHRRKAAVPHTAKRHTAKHMHSKAHKPTKAAAPRLAPASCEDETTPVRQSNGSFACDDGSEPACEDESSPIRSGHALACVIPPGTSPSPSPGEAPCETTAESFCYTGSAGGTEPSCEDGSAPITSSDGSETLCDDGTEPSCEDGLPPTAGPNGGLLCEAGPAEP